MSDEYERPEPDAIADWLACAAADVADRAEYAWLADRLHDHAEPGAAPKDCRP